MRIGYAALLIAVSASPALAQLGPAIPGRPDVPVFENGVDVLWAVIEGEFGLGQPGLVTPTVIYRLPPVVVPDQQPGYGRLQVVPGPNRPLPPPAQSYRPSWSSSSAPTPADLPSPYPPTYIAPVIAPSIYGPGPNQRPWGRGAKPGYSGQPSGGHPPGGQSFNRPPGPPPNTPRRGQPPGPGPGHDDW